MPSVREHVEGHAAQRPEQVFLIAPESGQQVTFAGLARQVDEIGAHLAGLGVPVQGKVAFLLDNGLWSTLLMLATMASRRVIVPLNAVAGPEQLGYVLAHSDAGVLFVSAAHRARINAVLRDLGRPLQVIETDEDQGPAWPAGLSADDPGGAPGADDPALLLYTSGTTGRPKGAVLTQRAVCAGGRNVTLAHGLTPGDRALCVLPIYHINGAMVTVSAPLVSGGSVVMPHRFSARAFWDLVATHACTWSSLVPTVIKYLLEHAGEAGYRFGDDPRLAALRFARSASAALPPVVLEQWERTFRVPMLETLGLTETAGTVLANPMPPAPRKPGSVGIAFGDEARVVDEHGRELPVGDTGELVIRGENVLREYYKNPEATQAAFVDGWFRTGDLGRRDAEGYFFLSGRIKELIIRGGENIAPREIDEVLYRHEAVLEAAAVGVPDENYGQEVVACVVRRAGHSCSEAQLRAFCSAAVGEYKAPKRIYFLDDLPKGPSGKIQRLKLPELIAGEG